MQTVRTKRLKSRRLDLPPTVFVVLLAVLAGLALLSRVAEQSDSGADDAARQGVTTLPNVAEDVRLRDENVNHPDVVGDIALIEAGYPDGVMEATDVQLNRAVAVAVNPELTTGRERAIFLEQNIMLPGDVGHLDDRALSIEEIQFLEWNTVLPGGDGLALVPPDNQRRDLGDGFTNF